METHAFRQTDRDAPGLPPRGSQTGRGGEPLFNAPWPALALAGSIIVGYSLQSLGPADLVLETLGFSPRALLDGRWPSIVTAIFLHGGWAHALMNAAFGLAFATPVARFFGQRLGGVLAFLGLYLACGVSANLGYAVLHWGDPHVLVGASGALSGLMGATSRLIAGQGRIGPMASRPVAAMGGAWIVINLLIALFGDSFAPGGAAGAPVAWDAHLLGFAAGLLLISPVAALAGRR